MKIAKVPDYYENDKWSTYFWFIPKKQSQNIKLGAYLLRWDIERDGTKINFAVSVDARNDKEDTGSPGSTFEQTTQAENNGSFVFLYHLATVNNHRIF